MMYGAIIGDIVGCRFEIYNHKSKEFELLTDSNHMTDDSMMTLAVSKTLLDNKDDLYNIDKIKEDAINNMVKFFHYNEHIGYGPSFRRWCYDPLHKPYNSYGNGAGMRISAVGWFSNSVEQVKALSKAITEVSHNHPDSIKGAEAIALSIYYLRNGKDKEFIKNLIINDYYPSLEYIDYDDLVKHYKFDVSCEGSIPQAIYAFLISSSFEDTLRTSVSIGGDTDTIASMACALAEAFYKDIDSSLINQINRYISIKYRILIDEFYDFFKCNR